MSPLLSTIIILSFVGLFLISIYRFLRQKKIINFCIQLVSICGSFILLYFIVLRPEILVTKGDSSSEIYFVIVLYVCMLLGIFAHYGYFRLNRQNGNKKVFDWGLFIAPVLISMWSIELSRISSLSTIEICLNLFIWWFTSLYFSIFFIGDFIGEDSIFIYSWCSLILLRQSLR